MNSNSSPRALITGVYGQDGQLLAQLLLGKGYQVLGTSRSVDKQPEMFKSETNPNLQIRIYEQEMTDSFFKALLEEFQPDEIYHLAAPSFVPDSWKRPVETTAGVAGPLDIFIEHLRKSSTACLFYSSSSEVFGRQQPAFYSETTPFSPVSPYGLAKAHVQNLLKLLRDAEGLKIVTGILFNHESHLRPERFVTMKICRGLQRNLQTGQPIDLGSLDSARDWGAAVDFVRAFQELTSQCHLGDFVIATGRRSTVREFVNATARALDLDLVWSGRGIEEKAHERRTGRLVVQVNPEFFREGEPDAPCGNNSKLRKTLGWAPESDLDRLVKLMMS